MATFTNKATLSYNGVTTDSNTVVGTFAESLTVQKNALTDTYASDSTLTYVISLVNTGAAPLSGLALSDDLGGYSLGTGTVYPLAYVGGSLAYYVNGVLQPDPAVTAGPPLTVSGINVPAGGNAVVIYQADVTPFAPLGQAGEITNTVTVTGLGECLTATETVTTVDEPQLSITKSLTPTNVPENGALTYTFVIENNGNTPTVATDDLTVTDLFDPILDITSVTLDGVALEEGTGYTYNEATGLFQTLPTVIVVPAATYTRQPDGTVVTTPGSVTLTVTGTI